MRWLGRRSSNNVVDRRGNGGKVIGGGIGTLVIVVIISLITGKNPLQYIDSSAVTDTQTAYVPTPTEEENAKFVSVVLAETEDVWNKLFDEQLNANYIEPKLVLFSGSDQSGCGAANAATGPFYCSEDSRVYIDLSFYDELKNRFKAPGDFAMAYVIAHEVGHHIQHLQGISDKIHQQKQQFNEKDANELSVRLELQADFFAGVWAHYAARMNLLEKGDIEEALNAANAIGDDRLQQQSQGYVVPDAFTHGTSKQRVFWFKKGYDSGIISEGDTFAAKSL
ncbi:MAG: neutral zinc metallopeptidase [Bacteroidia bacterium]